MELFFITLLIIALCFAGIGIRIWIKGKFAETEIGTNKHMREKGLTCAKEEEISLINGKQSACGSCRLCCSMKESC